MKRFVITLVNTMQSHDNLLESTIATPDGELYKNIVRRIYSVTKTFERTTSWNELVQSSDEKPTLKSKI